MNPPTLELLAPARDADIGIEAIRHGADAVYIGGPAFGARHGAGNAIADIERLARFAHRFHARVFVTLNTIFTDAELEPAAQLAHDVYAAGADALIVQDMGLLECDLPPIELHASTQCDIRTPAKACFLADAGFSQLVLARELDLDQVRAIHHALAANYSGGGTAHPSLDAPPLLEYFVHGALCVAYSGQCYISHAHTGRSANRGECSQACRLPYTLEDAQGRVVAFDKHLLSMKDNDQSANLAQLASAGVRSFKIEGRLKDMSYVKNATAHYRRLLDALIDEAAGGAPRYARASAGRTTHFFTPQPEKTFHRGSTDYFTHGRGGDIAAFDTPKFAGEAIGEVIRVTAEFFDIATDADLHNGDGVSYLVARRSAGLRLNTVTAIPGGVRAVPRHMPDDLRPGMTLYRNRDQAFERALEKPSAERHIDVHLSLEATATGLRLAIQDAEGIAAQAVAALQAEPARDADAARARIADAMAKLGGTDYRAAGVAVAIEPPCFVPAAVLNALRREAVAALDAAREAARPRGTRRAERQPPTPYPETALSYLANVLNVKARAFYQRHGVQLIADAYEADTTAGEVSLMITKHCLRYSTSLCPKEAKGWVKGVDAAPMTLVNGKERLSLRFDCKACEMHVVGRSRQRRIIAIHPQGH